MAIEKTNRMNALFEFYSTLLTEKQMNYVEFYYADDFSLTEIADEYGVSRQAVYDNIKRTEKILENYERNLHLYANFIMREDLLNKINVHVKDKYPEDLELQKMIRAIQEIEE
ncbi:putative DNA-binding protein [Vagococcus salmoninarum]|uniref:putative DNA-binding protein n=1 Tax=Vagococcus salmoninarum TaxID=2739 RepID=UPI003F94FE26